MISSAYVELSSFNFTSIYILLIIIAVVIVNISTNWNRVFRFFSTFFKLGYIVLIENTHTYFAMGGVIYDMYSPSSPRSNNFIIENTSTQAFLWSYQVLINYSSLIRYPLRSSRYRFLWNKLFFNRCKLPWYRRNTFIWYNYFFLTRYYLTTNRFLRLYRFFRFLNRYNRFFNRY